MLPLTMKLNSKNTRTQPQMTSHTNYQTVTLSPSRTKDSDAQNSSSSQPSLVLRFQGSTNWPSNPSWNVILMSERTFMETSLCPVVPLCSLVFQRDSAKKLLLLLPQPWKSRLLPHLKENSPSGSEDQSFHHSPPSKPCGSPEPNMMNQAQASYTENVSDLTHELHL